MNISEAALRSGMSAKMIRYHEATGLIPKVKRSEAGYRDYCDADVHTLRFVRSARDLGFAVDKIGKLLALGRDRGRASADVKQLALEHVAELEAKAAELRAMGRVLRDLAERCNGNDRPDCPIVEELANVVLPKRSNVRGVTRAKASADGSAKGSADGSAKGSATRFGLGQ